MQAIQGLSKLGAPSTHEIKKLRDHVMRIMGVGQTEAQTICATATYSHLRTWQRWESGERNMPASVWELALIKLSGEYISYMSSK